MYIFSKVPVRDRTQLSPKLAIEYMKLSMVVGEALKSAMARRGVDIGIINYQDMGNWSVFKPDGPTLHMQIYGRATTATIHKYGDAVQLPHRDTGFYDNFKPLDDVDIKEIKADVEKLLVSDKYKGRRCTGRGGPAGRGLYADIGIKLIMPMPRLCRCGGGRCW